MTQPLLARSSSACWISILKLIALKIRKSHFYWLSNLWHKLWSCLLICFSVVFCDPKFFVSKEGQTWTVAWHTARVYPSKGGMPRSASAAEPGDLFFCRFVCLFFLSCFFFPPDFTLPSSTFHIWWFGSGSYNFLNATFTGFDFFGASFIVVGQFHIQLWKIWALRSKYKISANTWTQSSCQ